MDSKEDKKHAEKVSVSEGKKTTRSRPNREKAKQNKSGSSSNAKQLNQDQKRMYPDLQGPPPVVVPGGYVSTLLGTVSGKTQVLDVIERNLYLVNVQSIIDVFHECELFVTSLNRRGGWRPGWYYTGLWMRRFAGRLQRVSNSTGQAVFDPSELIDVRGECPLIVSHFINQFGIVEDSNTRSVLYPAVTLQLVKYLAEYGRKLMITPAPANVAEIQDVDHHASYIEHCYGIDLQENLFLARHFARIGVSFQVSLNANTRRQSIAYSVNTHRRISGNAAINGAQWTNIGQDGGMNPLLQHASAGGGAGVLGGIAGVLAPALAQFNNNAGDYVSAVDLAGNHALPANLAPIRSHPNQMIVEVEDMEIRARFITGAVSVSPEGSWAPIVKAVNPDTDVSGIIGVKGVTVNEYIIGVLLNNYVTSMSRDYLPFNWAVIGRQNDKFSIPPLGYSRIELLAKVLRECVSRRNG